MVEWRTTFRTCTSGSCRPRSKEISSSLCSLEALLHSVHLLDDAAIAHRLPLKNIIIKRHGRVPLYREDNIEDFELGKDDT